MADAKQLIEQVVRGAITESAVVNKKDLLAAMQGSASGKFKDSDALIDEFHSKVPPVLLVIVDALISERDYSPARVEKELFPLLNLK